MTYYYNNINGSEKLNIEDLLSDIEICFHYFVLPIYYF